MKKKLSLFYLFSLIPFIGGREKKGGGNNIDFVKETLTFFLKTQLFLYISKIILSIYLTLF